MAGRILISIVIFFVSISNTLHANQHSIKQERIRKIAAKTFEIEEIRRAVVDNINADIKERYGVVPEYAIKNSQKIVNEYIWRIEKNLIEDYVKFIDENFDEQEIAQVFNYIESEVGAKWFKIVHGRGAIERMPSWIGALNEIYQSMMERIQISLEIDGVRRLDSQKK